MPETSETGPAAQQPQPQAAPSPDGPDPLAGSPAPRPRSLLRRRRGMLIAGIAVIVTAITATVLGSRPSAQPEQGALPPPCELVMATTVARYLPGATSKPMGSSLPGGCEWHSTSLSLGQRDLIVAANTFGSPSEATLARNAFNADAHSTFSSSDGAITTNRQPVTGLGDQAMALEQYGKDNVPQTPVVALYTRSGSTVVTVVLAINSPGSDTPPASTQLLSDTIAITRNVLTVLAKTS
jgi:hypothetical protein